MIRNYFLILIVILSISLSGACSRKINPSASENTKSDLDQARFNLYYVEGIKQKLMGNSGDAIKFLEEAIELNKSSDAAYYQIAQILASGGDIQNAKTYLKRAIGIDGSNMWYLTMMAGFYYQEKNVDSSIFYYEAAVKYFPDKEDLQLTLGALYTEDKNYDKAVAIYESFNTKYGVNQNSTVAEIRTLVLAGKFDMAEERAKSLIKDYPDEILLNGLLADIYKGKGEIEKARDVYNKLLERNPEDPVLQLSLCDFLISQKDYDQLFILLNSISLNTAIKREDKISLFARLVENQDIIENKRDDIIISLMVLEANYKGDDIIPLLRPDLLIKTGKVKEAEERLEELIKFNPENYFAWEKLLLAYYQSKDFVKLFSKGEECATKFNRMFLPKILYANAAMELKKFELALDELRKAEILAGNNPELQNQVISMKADIYYKMKDYNKAFEIFREALKQNKNDLTIINNYAYYLAEQNQNLKEAEELAKSVIDSEKDNPTYLDTYAWVLYKRGKFKEAARIMDSIIKIHNPQDAEYFEHYGFMQKALHNCDKARESWNNAYKIDSTKTYLLEEVKKCIK